MRLGVSGHTQNPSPCQLINSCPPPYSPPSTLFTLPPSPFSFFHPPPCSPSLRISSPLRRPRTQRFPPPRRHRRHLGSGFHRSGLDSTSQNHLPDPKHIPSPPSTFVVIDTQACQKEYVFVASRLLDFVL
ncbi:hypothetical protein CHARACLAT_008659 [Characodon lateralis]|uniref:Uncharacterized protein n=1 Tax=Characodon lateralis TaxID=208331 RepID=A0ABU7EKQ6_9TELE|nr:hypothetical protein [Characodon lateralis]